MMSSGYAERKFDECGLGGTLVAEMNGRNLWPPEGRGCDALVRYCEEAGLIVNSGAAVRGERSEQSMICLGTGMIGSIGLPLEDSDGRSPCERALNTLREQGVTFPSR